MLKTLFLDLDGTLLDSEPLWRQAPIRLLCSKDFLVPEYILNHQDELDMRGSIRAIMQDEALWSKLGMTYEECEQWCFDNMTKLYHTTLELKPNAQELVRFAKEQGLNVMIVTATEEKNARKICERFGLTACVDLIHSTFGKPVKKSSADLFHALMEQVNCSPEECVLLDDAMYAHQGAKAAGCQAWAIWDPIRKLVWSEICAGADAHFNDLSEVQQRIAELL